MATAPIAAYAAAPPGAPARVPAPPRAPAQVPVPPGWRLRPARGARLLRGGEVLLGGTPLRILTLTGLGAHLVSAWLAGQPVGETLEERLLARRLLDAGLADPDPPAHAGAYDAVTIVVPVYGQPERLSACLAPLAGGPPVIVVDDGSPDAGALEAVARRHGARLVRHPDNRGPAAARNTGLRQAATPLVAFLDSDCIPPPGFPAALLGHFADPAIALAAPRVVVPSRHPGRIAAYERHRSALDMGPNPSLVRPYSRVWYVPSAAMVARRDALGAGFDEELALGEDVDLVWRLHDAGWQVRYDPRTRVMHSHRTDLASWYRRRVAYNESVAPLLRRHPERVPVMFLSPPAALAWAAALGGWSGPLLALTGARGWRMRRALSCFVPRASASAARMAAEVTAREGRDLARALGGPRAPLAIAASRLGRDRVLARRSAALLGAMALGDWLADRPGVDPLSYAALRLADESSRGVGIWLGCLRAGDLRALLPRRPPPPERR